MDLKQQIQEDMKTAMREKNQARLGTIRMLLAAIKQREIDERITLDDVEVLNVINKMIKQRRESIAQFEAANRTELAEKEKQEIEVLHHYLPEQLSEAKIADIITTAIKNSGATSMQDMGKVMAVLKQELAGRADMALVSKKVKEALS